LNHLEAFRTQIFPLKKLFRESRPLTRKGVVDYGFAGSLSKPARERIVIFYVGEDLRK
jgi:hypothetical protein